MIKIISIAGARPQFIKTGILDRTLQQQPDVKHLIVHTGQHFDADMSDRFFTELQIPSPAYNLSVNRLPHGAMTGRMLEKIEEVLVQEAPQLVIVYGDTNSTLAGAMAAAKLHIPVAHIEAGLRSFDMRMPEEVNRILTDRLSQLLFCPTTTAMENLAAEGYAGFPVQRILSGDIMYDAARYYSRLPSGETVPDAPFVLATLHREEILQSAGKLRTVVQELNRLQGEVPVLFAAHPRTQAALKALEEEIRFRVVPPYGYLQMLRLLQACTAVFTDSGGLQKEAYFFRKPCITARENTEWTELVATGANVLWSPGKEALTELYSRLMNGAPDFNRQPYGDGHSCTLIVDSLLNFLKQHA